MKFINKKHNLLSIIFLNFICASMSFASANTNIPNIDNKDNPSTTLKLNLDSIYSPISSNKFMSAVASQYQAFTIPGSTTFNYFLWNFYSNTNCTGLIDSVQIGFQGAPETLGPNTYTAYDAASQKICDKLSGSCAAELTTTNSIQVSYVYSSGSSTLGQCYNNSGAGDKLAAAGSTTCTSISCLFAGSYNPDALSLWTYVGNEKVSPSGGLQKYTSLAISKNGIPYVSYTDNTTGYKATVKKFDGASWVYVGTNGTVTTTGNASYNSLAIDQSGTPYLAFQDGTNGPASVTKFSSGSWAYLGNAGFSGGSAYYTSLAINQSGTPYVAFQDGADGPATVMKFNGTTWESVGTARFSAGEAYFTSLAIDESGTPYVAYEDGTIGYKATVMKFNGSAWESVGTAGFSAGEAGGIRLAINESGTPYVAFQDANNGYGVTVMKFNGSSWVYVGSPGFSGGSSTYISLAINESGTPYVAYRLAPDYTAQVVKFNGSTWIIVGNLSLFGDNPQVNYMSLAINESGIIYTAYANPITIGVIKFNGN